MRLRLCRPYKADSCRRRPVDGLTGVRLGYQRGASHSEAATESITEIFEICGDAKIATAYELNDCLKFIFLFARDPNLSVL
jgi:hypothetical protein